MSTPVDSELLAELSKPFPKEVERQLEKSGVTLTYIPVSEVIARLNDVFGVFGWSYTQISCDRDALDPDFLVAHVRMTVGDITRDGVGGQTIKRKRDGGIVDLGDEYKGAVSDALKKAAQSFGVGLYLARGHSSPAPAGQQTRQQGETRITEPSNLASDKQQNMIRAVCKSMGKVPPHNLQAMTKREASAYIDTLKSGEQPAPQYDNTEEAF
jgi:hypothetical protein